MQSTLLWYDKELATEKPAAQEAHVKSKIQENFGEEFEDLGQNFAAIDCPVMTKAAIQQSIKTVLIVSGSDGQDFLSQLNAPGLTQIPNLHSVIVYCKTTEEADEWNEMKNQGLAWTKIVAAVLTEKSDVIDAAKDLYAQAMAM